ncbi:TetR/AcrR family transcriptional regulator [Sphingomonas adhaesiva]|uniref:TetR/AcrR family transcriptional regulator n=1 Tax=Sphingomonas adhaesiva TaxID=28212 RepID=UPI002FF7A55F
MKVVQAARELFIEHGFHATGIARIAQASGVLVGQIYRDFANKEAIVAALVVEDLDRCLRPNELCAAGGSGDRDAIRAWLRNYLAGSEVTDVRLVMEIMAESARNDRIKEVFRSVDSLMRAQLTAALSALAPPGAAPERVACLTDAVRIMGGGSFHHWLSEGKGPAAPVVDMLMDLIEREIAALAGS